MTLQTCLTSMMGKPITMDQLRQDVGNMVEKITKVIAIFRQFQLKMEEYVCLKVIAMVSQEGKPAEYYTGCGSHFENLANFQDSERTIACTETNDIPEESP